MEPIPRQIAAITRPVDQLLTYYALKALATTIAFPVTMVLLYFRYHTMRYVFSDEGIRMSWGILFRHEIMLNYARIQDIHLRSNAVERALGLARIEIQTASGGSSEMTLEGLTDHEAMRDFLYSRMRGATHLTPATSESARLAGVLDEIAVELRAIRAAVERRA
ncbi:MAG: PH domain-containing protein [Bryobacteraceae bacterium]|nr:PH domain-containing protein [Bryobacteraceae bacterium]